jgi:hypothetical protein
MTLMIRYKKISLSFFLAICLLAMCFPQQVCHLAEARTSTVISIKGSNANHHWRDLQKDDNKNNKDKNKNNDTPNPTRKPTRAPTRKPTRAPTREPTRAPTRKPTPVPSIEAEVPSVTLSLLPFEITLQANDSNEFDYLEIPLELALRLFLQEKFMSQWDHHSLQRISLQYEKPANKILPTTKEKAFTFSGDTRFVDNEFTPSIDLLHSTQNQALTSNIPQLEELLQQYEIPLAVSGIFVISGGNQDESHNEETDNQESVISENVPTSYFFVSGIVICIASIAFCVMVRKKSRLIKAKLDLQEENVDVSFGETILS